MAERAPLIADPGVAITSWVESVPGETEIAHNEVHVWRLNLRNAAASEKLLSEDERRRATQMIAAAARQAFVATRSTLRTLISQYDGSDAGSLVFTTGPHGKPKLDRPGSSLEFNLSHSGDWAVIALSRGLPLGVDVEQIRPDRAKKELAERFFSPRENEMLKATDAERIASFFRLWARKEAYLKATGIGLATGFSKIDASTDGLPDLDASGEPTSPDPVWYAAEFMVDTTHPACVVARARHFALKLYDFGTLRT